MQNWRSLKRKLGDDGDGSSVWPDYDEDEEERNAGSGMKPERSSERLISHTID